MAAELKNAITNPGKLKKVKRVKKEKKKNEPAWFNKVLLKKVRKAVSLRRQTLSKAV